MFAREDLSYSHIHLRDFIRSHDVPSETQFTRRRGCSDPTIHLALNDRKHCLCNSLDSPPELPLQNRTSDTLVGVAVRTRDPDVSCGTLSNVYDFIYDSYKSCDKANSLENSEIIPNNSRKSQVLAVTPENPLILSHQLRIAMPLKKVCFASSRFLF